MRRCSCHQSGSEQDKQIYLHQQHILLCTDATETGSSINIEAKEFLSELSIRISQITMEPLETQYLIQRLSISLQRGNEFAFRNTFNCMKLQL